MTFEQLLTLRTMTLRTRNTGQGLRDAMTYFRDHNGDELDVLKGAEATSNPFITDVLEFFVEAVVGNPATVNLILARLPSMQFYFGSFHANGLFGWLFYFAGPDDRGIMGMQDPADPQSTIKYRLFTTRTSTS